MWLGQIGKSRSRESATLVQPVYEKGRSDGRCDLDRISADRNPGLPAW
jgi:hypothetical protein